jgi:hypothetical protein
MNPQAPSVSSAVAPFFLIVDVSGMLAASFQIGHPVPGLDETSGLAIQVH